MNRIVFLISVVLAGALVANAIPLEDRYVDGDWIFDNGYSYLITGKGECELSDYRYYVEEQMCSSYEGNVDIPAFVYRDGARFDVTSVVAFDYGHEIKSISVPSTVRSFHGAYNCTEAGEITFEEGIEELYGLFSCGVRKLSLPESITTFGAECCCACILMESLEIKSRATEFPEDAFSWLHALTNLDMGNRVRRVGENVFSSLKSIEEFSIPGSVALIEEGAFSDCDRLERVVILSRSLELRDAFRNCPAVKDIECHSMVPPMVEGNSFGETDRATCRLHVPQGSITAYQADDFWNGFAIIEDDLPSEVNQVESENTEITVSGHEITIKCEGESDFTVFRPDGSKVGEYRVRDEVTIELPEGIYVAAGAGINKTVIIR